jgi:DNA primase large subunit
MSNTRHSTKETTEDRASRGTELRDSPMMAHLLDALEEGTDIGHYGRLTFVMVARHFMPEDEIVELLAKQPDQSEEEAKTLYKQVEGHDYNPPKRERILEWQSLQDFPICPDSDDPSSCNVYSELRFPDGIYENIGQYWEEKADTGDDDRDDNGKQ